MPYVNTSKYEIEYIYVLYWLKSVPLAFTTSLSSPYITNPIDSIQIYTHFLIGFDTLLNWHT